ncbi:MAG: cysteine hydrolase family protein [Sulfuricellaceae bacterium]
MHKLILLIALLLFHPCAGYAAETARAPRTLMQIAGVQLPTAKFSDSVLLVIDAQREYTDGKLPLAGIGAAVAETALLLKLARQADAPVIHVIHKSKPGAMLFDPNGPFVDFIPQLAPAPGETVIVKGLPNAFAATNLDRHLAVLGRKNLIVAGFATHMCVSATVRAALDHGYRTTLVASATATRDLPDGMGGSVPAAVLQQAGIAALNDRFATIVAGAANIPLR